MALLTKPNMQQVWASGGDIVEPSDLKKQQGWTVEVPPHQFENWVQNRQDEYLAHINQRGIPQWDGNTDYEAAGLSYVQGSDGTIYKSVAASGPSTTAQNPTTDVSDTYWTIAFSPNTAASETVRGIVELATTVEAQTGTDDLRAMTPLKVRQAIAQFGSDFINTTRIDVASAATVNLTTAAPNTRNINITGGTTISAFTVAAGQQYFVRFNARITLTNGAAIITQTGSDLQLDAGDTCVLRATAANTVEVTLLSRKGLPTLLDNTTDLNNMQEPGPWPSLVGGAAGSRNANFPDGQTAIVVGNGATNFYWIEVKRYSTNLVQIAWPYVTGVDTAIAAPKYRLLGGGTWSPWRTMYHDANLPQDRARVDVASASTVNLTASTAPFTRGIRITGSTTINGFTIPAGRSYEVVFGAVVTLTNSASLVTNTGANIVAVAGDSCVIRATADNVVEVLMYSRAAPPFSRFFVSAPQSITSGGGLTIAHGLGVAPFFVAIEFVCETADAGYSPGDRLQRPSGGSGIGGGSSVEVWPDSTNINVRYGTASWSIAHKTTGAQTTLTLANWRAVMRAFV